MVDDDQAIRGIFYFYLKRHDYMVDTAETCEKARRLLGQGKYDLVILDYYLPDMMGEEIAEKMLDIDKDAEIIMIICNPAVVEMSAEIGYSGTLLKPFKPEELARTVEKATSE